MIFMIWDKVPLWLNNTDSFCSCLQREFFIFRANFKLQCQHVSAVAVQHNGTCCHICLHQDSVMEYRASHVSRALRISSSGHIAVLLQNRLRSCGVLTRPPFLPTQLTHPRASCSYIRSPWELELNVPPAPAPDTACFHS